MTTTQPSTAPAGKCPVAHGFDAMGDAYYRDPAAHFAEVSGDAPTFFYPHLNAWIVTRKEDALTVLGDWKQFSSGSNGGLIDVPEEFAQTIPAELMSRILVGSDPPGHTHSRAVAQRGFLQERMEALRPEIERRAHRIIDGFEEKGSGNLLEDYCLELTTQTLMALMGLDYSLEPMMRQLRDDFFQVLASAQEPFPEPHRSEVWRRFTDANLTLREIIESRRDSDADDLISVMASAKDDDGSWSLEAAQIAIHLSEFAAAGTDTTAQAMANAVLFLNSAPDAVSEALADPGLWASVFEETVRRRPSSTFASRRAEVDIELGGAQIAAGDMVWIALAAVNTDPEHVSRPFDFDIHRPNPEDHYAFSQGRHKCLGNPLARVQGSTGLQVLFERLPSVRVTDPDDLDFVRFALLPARRSLHVTWDTEDIARSKERTVRTLQLRVARRREEADGVVSLTLEHPDGGELPPWKPGAHIDLHVPAAQLEAAGSDDGILLRQYSLCSDPADRRHYRVAVRREDEGKGGSRAVHESVQEGARLTVSWPRNTFHLAPSPRYLFIAGGIGITPILPMVHAAEEAGADWELHYAGRSRASMPFLDELSSFGDRVRLFPDDEGLRIDIAAELTDVREETLVYTCGPEAMLSNVEAAGSHWAPDAVRLERFLPKPIVRDEPDTAFDVEFARSGQTVTVGADETILEAAERVGLPVISSCQEGTCGTCETRLVSGRADHRDSILTAAEREADETMMICVSRAASGCPRLTLQR